MAGQGSGEAAVSIQDDVAAAVCDRGYYEKPNGDPWTKEQLAARQVAKLTEELGELSYYIPRCVMGWARRSSDWEMGLRLAARRAREDFDNPKAWGEAEVLHSDAAAEELADIQVVVFTLADALDVDVLELAREKALSDVERGVREASDAND
jgi:NTP pyrophosphatase (non-canonical NTP hydrolase)